MIDFSPVKNKEMSLAKFASGFTRADLRDLTNEMVDHMMGLIADCTDADVVFVPVDPDANDTYAADDAEADLAWTLGHVIVHVTASAEESAFTAAELARGVEFHGRSRYEVPWQTITTIQQCRDRLEESRRMRLATLDVWPDEPHLEVTYEPWPGASALNAIGRFIGGFWHDVDHLGQIAEIVRQAKAARER
ncbi:MAG: DinB family protein [Chloroflexi bacterium]|nr:DinB family protein [Chloroflexota bacterium]